MLRRYTPIPKIGRRKWRADERATDGRCAYCGVYGRRTWDHIIPRSVASLEWVHDKRNLIEACWDCNVGRTAGRKPHFSCLSMRSQIFVLEQIGNERAAHFFQGVPQPVTV